jgi:hypothetical protein
MLICKANPVIRSVDLFYIWWCPYENLPDFNRMAILVTPNKCFTYLKKTKRSIFFYFHDKCFQNFKVIVCYYTITAELYTVTLNFFCYYGKTLYKENVSQELHSLRAKPLPRSPGQVKLDSTSENYERICMNNFFFSLNLAFGQVGQKK